MRELPGSMSPGSLLLSFLLGGLISAGGIMLITAKLKSKKPALNPPEKRDMEGSGIYCQVPEGADICYPE